MVFGKGGLLQKLFLPGFANAGADTSFQARMHSSDDYDDDALVPDVMQRFAPRVWMVEGPTVHVFGLSYPTRMVAIRLSDASAWIWNPIALSDDLAVQIEKFVGPVRYIISPNRIHGLFLKEWQDRFPEAKVYAPPGLDERASSSSVKDVKFHATLSEETQPEFADEISHIVFEGGSMDEVVFFHKSTKTVIFCDLIQRHFEDDQRGFTGWWMRVNGLVGPMGSTPKEWSFAFWIYGKLPGARKNLDIVLQNWKPEGMIIAHGEVAPEAACVVIENALSWIPKEPKEFSCCFPK
jgi:hypothetical protein